MPEETRAVLPSTTVPGAAGETAAPDTETRTPESAAEAGSAWLSWRRAMLWGRSLIAFSATLSTTLLAGWIIYLVAEMTLRRHSLEIEAITVPKMLAEDGLSSAVVTQRLRDAMRSVQDHATTTMAKSDVEVRQNLSDISIPKTGISVESVAASIRGLLPERIVSPGVV